MTTPTPLPGAPSNLAASTSAPTQVDLTWTPGSGPITGYRIQRSTDGTTWPTTFTLANAAATSYSDTTVVGGTGYWYRIFAYNASGDSPASNVATVTTPAAAVLAAPSGVRLTRSGTIMYVYWTDNSNNETGFYVERSTDGTNFARIATTGANTGMYKNFGVVSGTRYWYRVQAFNGAGVSAYSSTVSNPL